MVLFFGKGHPTKKVWFYQLNLDRNLGKTNPLSEDDLAEFVSLQKKKQKSDNSWSVKAADIDSETLDLSVKNPNLQDETVLREFAKTNPLKAEWLQTGKVCMLSLNFSAIGQFLFDTQNIYHQ